MRILYGVVGEGMGHAMRSRVVIEGLAAAGHEVEVVVSGRAHDYLHNSMDGVHRIWGTAIAMANNEVQKRATARMFIRDAAHGLPDNLRLYQEMLGRFEPEAVITDFETWAAFFGYSRRIPVISLDNNQGLRRLQLPDDVLAGERGAWTLAKNIAKAKVPHAYHYLITAFFDAPPRKKRTTIVPPILRPQLLAATPSVGEHVLVYQTNPSFLSLTDTLRRSGVPCKIYGLRRDLTAPVIEDNLTFCPFSETTFVDDLASCRGVIASAGFTLITEALHMRKPYLATPVRGQFEQIMNARILSHLGYGMTDDDLSPEAVESFLSNLDRFADNLSAYPRHSNDVMFDHLNGLLDRVAAGL
jgi:uncharacterized protein (TIGR00661 family)